MLGKALLIATAASMLVSLGCVSRAPFFISGNATHIELTADDIVLQQPTQGTSSVVVFFGIKFGTPSYLEAETAALERQGSDILLDRIRYSGEEGLAIPFFGTVIGSKSLYVQGVGAKFTR